mgnify:FL=1
MNDLIFKEQMDKNIELINKRLDELLTGDYPEVIYEAMKYSMFAGGKRLRPVLLLETCRMFGGKDEDAIDFACALEMIHTYSLIHDDLPAMDDDDFRRGKLTCHKKFDEAIAILAGDALLNKAFEVMADNVVLKKEERFAKAMKFIADASGTRGMIGGQVVDVISEGKVIDAKTLTYIHEHKTAALITAPFKAGCAIGGGSDNDIENFDKVGLNVGISFQIKDDILDVTSSTEVLGKPILSDMKNNKITYVTMYGIETAERELTQRTNEAVSVIQKFGEKGRFLEYYIKSLDTRIK